MVYLKWIRGFNGDLEQSVRLSRYRSRITILERGEVSRKYFPIADSARS